jgi:hypothetical protein
MQKVNNHYMYLTNTKKYENQMNRSVNELNKKASLTAKLFLASVLITATSVSVAEEANQDTDVAYVDSVLKWGAWELDIEPAAGGISAPKTRALNARSSKVALRTNSIAALAPAGGAPVIPGKPPGGGPTLPPVVPAPPGLTPISPNVPIPVGGPGGSAAPAPTITTINPSVPIPVGGPGVPRGGPGAS